MSRLSAAAVRRRLRRLDPDELARFVAALWAATGWNTAVRGDRVLARRREPDERQVLRVVGSAGALAGLLARPPRDADRVVAPVGSRLAAAVAARTGREVVDAAALHERLAYAVPRGARERLVEEFLPPGPRRQRGPNRRAVLGAVATGATVGSAGGVAPGGPSGAVPGSNVRYDLGGPSEEAKPTGRPFGCGLDAREAVVRQLVALRRHDSVERAVTGGPELPPGGEEVELSPAFREAVESAGPPPFRSGSVVGVLHVDRDGPRATVPVRVETADRREVVYAVELQRSGDCWRIVEVRVARDLY